jgi:hypothetical protein
VANQHDRVLLLGMIGEDEPKGVGRARNEVLEGVAPRKADKMRALMPHGEEVRLLGTHLGMRFPLPVAVIQVI